MRWRPSRNRLKHSRENISEKNYEEKDTKQQQKCVPFETEDHKEGLEYTMMHTNFIKFFIINIFNEFLENSYIPETDVDCMNKSGWNNFIKTFDF